MCVIITLAENATINKEQFFNAVYNNWHGYGLILKDSNNRLQLIKKYSSDTEGTDPEELWKLLEDNKDCTRYLHLRHATKGGITQENIQPFEVYHSNNRQVFFMHNGTLHSFGVLNTSGDGKSDTRDFCEKILAPALLRWTGNSGKADYTDELFYSLIMDKHWTGGSTGLFVSNDLEPKRIGSGWSEYKHPDESSSGEVWTSNTTYYNRVQRGPMFQKLEQERKAKEEEERKASLINNGSPFREENGTTTNILMGPGHVDKWSPSNCAKSPRVLKALNTVLDNWDLDDPRQVSRLAFLTTEELTSYVMDQSDPFTLVCFIEVLSKHLYESQMEIRKKSFKLLKQQNIIKKHNIQVKEEDNESAAA